MRFWLTAATLILLTACGGRERHAVPLPEAYPRIEMPPALYTVADTLLTPLTINAAATVKAIDRDGSQWIDISYPGIDILRIYLTVSRFSNLDMPLAIDNRLERMTLNTGGAPGQRTTLTSDNGWDCLLLSTPSVTTTPVQLLATRPGLLLSATAHLSTGASTPPDSIAPIVEAVERDMLEMLKHL